MPGNLVMIPQILKISNSRNFTPACGALFSKIPNIFSFTVACDDANMLVTLD